jgi:S-methylmethionine-dependent homocysteine/selenocysteine methylase
MLLLDGAVATELQRHGVALTEPWMTSAPLRTATGQRLLERIHRDYLAAGAQVVTANTFRANLRALVRCGVDEGQATRLVQRAVGIAREACAGSGSTAVVAASIAPVEDCYQPALVPEESALRAEHGWLARTAAAAGAQIGLAETMNSVLEARVAVASAAAAGLVPWVSFVCTDGGRLLSGEDLGYATRVAEDEGARVVLVNCTGPGPMEQALEVLASVATVPVGAYPNIEDRSGLAAWTHVSGYVPVAQGPADFAVTVAGWRESAAAAAVLPSTSRRWPARWEPRMRAARGTPMGEADG